MAEAAERILGAITIGQAPRTDITEDILPLLPKGTILKEYGALDDFTYEEITEQFAPSSGDEVLVSRMRDGRQVKFAEKYVTPLVQQKITQAEADGALAVILFCTGAFPEFKHAKILLKPQPIFHAIAQKLAGSSKIGLFVPEPDQIGQAYAFWEKSGVSVDVVSASPYLDFQAIERAALNFKNSDAAFICLDCMGYSEAMKARIQEITQKPVLLPRTLVTRILCEFL